MSVLSGETIEKLIIESKELIIAPLDKECLQPASIDLKVGGKAMKGRAGEELAKVIDLVKENEVGILPGQFVSVLTLERLSLPPNICGRLGLRSSYARKGLVSFHGTQVDPGFSGHLVVPLVNMGPQLITLRYGKPFSTLELSYLETASSKPYSGGYQNQNDFSLEDVNFVLSAQMVSAPDILRVREEIAQLREVTRGIQNIPQDIHRLEESVQNLRGRYLQIFIGSFGVLLALLIAIVVKLFVT